MCFFTDGYGASIINLIRKAKSLIDTYDKLELPLTLGRDFAGVVVAKGQSVGDQLQLGEKVWGVVPIEQQGCHANYVIVNNNLVTLLLKR
jgi:NADPH:quinone reductase-like Zn-dependent oxidoreductase